MPSEPAPSPAPAAREAPAPALGIRDAVAVLALLAMFLTAQLTAVLLRRPFAASGIDQAFEDPGDWRNGLWLLLTVIVFTVIILWIARRKKEAFIQALILGSVGLTMVYVFYPLFDTIPGFDPFLVPLGPASFSLSYAAVLAFLPAGLLTWLLVRFPEWYVIDAVGIAVSAGAVAIFGASFTPVTYLVVLVAFAVYDYVSVYRTKHMLDLADSVLNLHLPIMLVVPKRLDYSFRKEHGRARERAEAATTPSPTAPPPGERDALFIGLGDIVIPSIFAVTAMTISGLAAFGTFVGINVGLAILMWFVLKGRPHAGLPTLNGAALVGFLVGLYADTGSVVFW